ncbi:SA1320 family protein [Clostridium sp. LP20]|uniref:SA1320 family protein n=1 Tax=Clostridium sp. LP20 TaxID=3418665 RepID=UPI003EE4D254
MENTTSIANISYQIEIWLYKGYSLNDIKKEIVDLKERNDFPKNLELIDVYWDETFGSSGCAFLDTKTGETIVGFAGTNLDNGISESSKDILTDAVGLAITGINNDSPYMKEANKFINSLKGKGYNITESTGHSLGGALCVYIGIKNDIPFITTFNGAPLYVLPTAHLTGTASLINSIMENYNGRITRFVSDEDWLNSLSDSANGFYLGDEYLIHNDAGHDLKFFMENETEKYISEILLANKIDRSTVLSLDFDGDGKSDLSLTPESLIVKNLFGRSGLYSGNGTTINIDPNAFYNLKENLENNMVNNDIEWINQAIGLCMDKNNRIKSDKTQREDTLCSKVVEGLNEASLTKLLSRIDNSHGKLVKGTNKNTLKLLSEFNTYNVTRKLDRWGSSGGRRWFLDGEEFDEYNLINWIKDLKKSADILYYQITTTGEFTSYSMYTSTPQVYRFDTISAIGKAFINVTNGFLSKTEEVFKGTGLRSVKNDGIVNSISEVLEVEEKNVAELKKQILNTAELSKGLAENFSDMDNWLGNSISQGIISGKYEVKNLPNSYKAYLEENNIFDDVKDVIEAYDLQVESAAINLSRNIVSDFNNLISRTQNKLKSIYNSLEDFINSVNSLDSRMNGNVTSKHFNTNLSGYNQYETTEVNTSHGILSNFFPSNISSCIEDSKRYIVPVLDSLSDALYLLDLYNSQLHDLKNYFKFIIEKAVYDSIELNSIVEAQILISARIERMMKEITRVDEVIELEYKGNSLKSYQTQLQSLVKSLEYFTLMLNDCFGENSKSS